MLPVIAPVESLSPLWLTAAISASSKLSACRSAQKTAMASASSPTQPSPS